MQRLGWVSEPNCGRGTASILESCLLTIILCTWTALHLNVPETKLEWWQSLWRKTKWTVFAVYLPEYVTWLAILQRASAEKFTEDMKKLGHPEWTVMQSYYAEMGGIYVPVEPDRALGETRSRLPLTEAKHFQLVKDAQLPSKNFIEDKSKADTFKRVITTIQAAWALAQVLGRWAQRLAISNLELSTVAYILCALATYIAWWDKPYDVSTITVLELSLPHDRNQADPSRRPNIGNDGNDDDWDDIIARQGSDYHHGARDNAGSLENVERVVDTDFNEQLSQLRSSFIFWASPDDAMIGHYTPSMTANIWWSFFLAVAFCSFGAIHVAGWNFSFPTIVEMWLWRVCSLIQLAVPLVLFFFLALKRIISDQFVWPRGRWVFSAYDIIQFPCGVLFLVARTTIIVLMFCTLRSSSPDIYKKQSWSSFVPHWG